MLNKEPQRSNKSRDALRGEQGQVQNCLRARRWKKDCGPKEGHQYGGELVTEYTVLCPRKCTLHIHRSENLKSKMY
jgi:hypothetical protein